MPMRLTKELSLNSVFGAVFMQYQQNRLNFEKEEMKPSVSLQHCMIHFLQAVKRN